MTTNELTTILEGALRNYAEKAAFGIEQMVAIIAAVIALAALYVAYQARKDSEKSAAAAQKSAEAAQKSNEIMARQLELAASELNRQIQKDLIDSQPHITWDHVSEGAQSVTQKMKNHGGVMSNLTVACDSGFQASISPNDVIPQGTEAEARFICNIQPMPNPFKFFFFVEFDDKFGQRKKMNFTASRQNGSWGLPKLA